MSDSTTLRGGRRPPFRADHVGSFLRPKRLLDAREQHKAGVISGAALRAVEDDAIRDIVRFQEGLGLRGITDGEFRRTYFHIDFLTRLSGVEIQGWHRGQLPQRRRQCRLRAAGDAGDRSGAPRPGDPARRLRVPALA